MAFKKVENDPFPSENGKMLVDETISIFDTWKAMEDLVKKGLVKRIGVSNFTIELLEKMRFHPEVTIQPYTNQVECHLYMQQEALIEYCAKHNIIVTTHTSIGRPSKDPNSTAPNLLEDDELVKVSKELNRPVVNVAIKFLQSLGSNVVVLVKSVTPQRIKSNSELDFELTQDQILRLKKRERCTRFANMKKLWGVNVFSDSW